MAEQLETAPATPATSDAKPYRRVIDLGGGAGPEVFEGITMEELADKLADAKGHASKKIREQEAELRDWRTRGEKDATVEAFVAEHGDYLNGDKNAELMRLKLNELGLPVTSENLEKAYTHLKERGFLELRTEEVSATGKAQEAPKAEATQQRTRKTSGISTQSSRAVPPANTEPSEHDLYTMPLEKLRALSNKQTRASGW